MFLSIFKIDTDEMRTLIESYIDDFDDAGLFEGRPSHATRRACALALARDLLVKNDLISREGARQTTIQHAESGEPYLKFPKAEGRRKSRTSASPIPGGGSPV